MYAKKSLTPSKDEFIRLLTDTQKSKMELEALMRSLDPKVVPEA